MHFLIHIITFGHKKPKRRIFSQHVNFIIVIVEKPVAFILNGLYEVNGPIGGPGHIIECDEMKLGERK